MNSPVDSLAYVKRLADEAEVRTPRSADPLVVSSRITEELVPAGPYAPVLPTDIASLRLLAFAAQMQGRTLIAEAKNQTEMVDGMSWLRVSGLAAFVSGADTDPAKDHLLVAAIFHRMGETGLAEDEFLAAHNALQAVGEDSAWNGYGSLPAEEKDEMADAATALQKRDGAQYRDFVTHDEPAAADSPEVPIVELDPQNDEATLYEASSTERFREAAQNPVARGAQAFRGLQEKLAAQDDADIDHGEVPAATAAEADESTFAPPQETPAPEEFPEPAPEPTAESSSRQGSLLPSVASILAQPFVYPDSLTDNNLRQELLAYPATTAGEMMLDAYERAQEVHSDPLLGLYFANHEHEAYRRIGDPVGMSHALARVALSRRNTGQGDQKTLYQAFETTTQALKLVEGFPAYPDVARPSLPSALLFLDAGQPQQAIQQLTPVIAAGEDLLDSTGTVDRLLADLYTVRSKAFNDQLAMTGSNDDRRRISEDYTRAMELYSAVGEPEGFQQARERYRI